EGAVCVHHPGAALLHVCGHVLGRLPQNLFGRSEAWISERRAITRRSGDWYQRSNESQRAVEASLGVAVRRDRCRIFHVVRLSDRRRLSEPMVATNSGDETSRAARK